MVVVCTEAACTVDTLDTVTGMGSVWEVVMDTAGWAVSECESQGLVVRTTINGRLTWTRPLRGAPLLGLGTGMLLGGALF
jgi:hypothetical protein